MAASTTRASFQALDLKLYGTIYPLFSRIASTLTMVLTVRSLSLGVVDVTVLVTRILATTLSDSRRVVSAISMRRKTDASEVVQMVHFFWNV